MNTDLEKEFVPYTESLELKELGFDEPCFMQWTYAHEIIFCTSSWGHPKFKTNKESYSDSGGDCISGPTFSQAFRFFREKYGLVSVVIPTVNMFWTYKVVRSLEGQVEFPPYKDVCAYDYSTYDKAELECLREIIEIVKNKEI